MNDRDHRGWRIPRKHTKSWEVYQFLINGWSYNQIVNVMQEGNNIKVLICKIKNPDLYNEMNNRSNKKRYREKVLSR